VYCSVVFQGSLSYIHGEGICYGGSGSNNLSLCLPDEVEMLPPDYSIYPDNNVSYGFISRGCIRNCSFCIVPRKEGSIRQVSIIEDIVRHPVTKFLDNNILALPNHKDILQELSDKGIRHQFNQGLDIRLVDAENSKLLSKLNYHGEYIFAFDSWKYRELIEDKLHLLDWRKDWKFKFFVYIHPSMSVHETVSRVEWLRERKMLPYIMRDISCWESPLHFFYTDIAAWCNQVGFFKKMSFYDFLSKRHTSGERARRSLAVYNGECISVKKKMFLF